MRYSLEVYCKHCQLGAERVKRYGVGSYLFRNATGVGNCRTKGNTTPHNELIPNVNE